MALLCLGIAMLFRILYVSKKSKNIQGVPLKIIELLRFKVNLIWSDFSLLNT